MVLADKKSKKRIHQIIIIKIFAKNTHYPGKWQKRRKSTKSILQKTPLAF